MVVVFIKNKYPVQDDEYKYYDSLQTSLIARGNRQLSFGWNPSLFLKLFGHYIRLSSGKVCHLVHIRDHLGARNQFGVEGAGEGSFPQLNTEFSLS